MIATDKKTIAEIKKAAEINKAAGGWVTSPKLPPAPGPKK